MSCSERFRCSKNVKSFSGWRLMIYGQSKMLVGKANFRSTGLQLQNGLFSSESRTGSSDAVQFAQDT
eukprot:1887225-Pleurochrysis_carterae.AAC.1